MGNKQRRLPPKDSKAAEKEKIQKQAKVRAKENSLEQEMQNLQLTRANLQKLENLSIQPLPAPRLTIDIKDLPSHPAIRIMGIHAIHINLEFCVDMPDPVTNMRTLLEVLPAYQPIVHTMAIKIHGPFPRMDRYEWHVSRVQWMKKFFDMLNDFWFHSLRINMFLDNLNFPQMKLGAGAYGLKFKKWTLTYEVYRSEGELVDVTVGSVLDRRLLGIYRKEFLLCPKVKEGPVKEESAKKA